MNDGTYIWSILANDSAGNSNTTENFTITIDTTSPAITLDAPSNSTSFTEQGINFRFSANENVKNCSLILDNSVVANESTQKTSYNFTIAGISFGSHKWNASCYDLANNAGSSGVFDFIVIQAGGGGGASPSSPSGSGGGLPTSELTSENPQYTYTIEYVCSRTKEFISNHTINGIYNGYSSEDMAGHQLRITKEIGYSISERTLREYIDYSESYCKIQKGKESILPSISNPINNIQEFLSIGNMQDIVSDSKILNYTIGSYFPIPINIGSVKLPEDNAVGILNFLGILFKIKLSDPYSSNPNVILFPRAISSISIIGIAIYFINRRQRKPTALAVG